MIQRCVTILAALILAMTVFSCVKVDDIDLPEVRTLQKIDFDITVMRDGQTIPRERYGIMTKGGAIFDEIATMDPNHPFGLMVFDAESGALVMNNQRISYGSSGYSGSYGDDPWTGVSQVKVSAYYPYKTSVAYQEGQTGYMIPFTTDETEAGPLISKTMQRAVDQLNQLPIEFHHITNDIGYKICDVTPDEFLQGLVHLRKLTVYNVASAGTYVNEMVNNRLGYWRKVGYHRNIVVFDGDARVGVGSDNELFVGYETLEERMADSHRYYSIPDDIELGKQYVEVVFDIDGFTLNNFDYPPVAGQVLRYGLYGLLPDNVFVSGKQYTFHIGIDLSSVYHEITFAPSVSDWETKIYENNDTF